MTGQNLKVNYGECNVRPFDLWVKECDFPEKGSFSGRLLEALKRTLKEKERESDGG